MSSAAHTGKKVESFESHNVKSGGKKKKKSGKCCKPGYLSSPTTTINEQSLLLSYLPAIQNTLHTEL